MANTIQLKLLENKSIVAEINGRNYAYEGGYNIIAGEKNATEFEIASVPAQYKDYAVSVALTNLRGQQITPPDIVDNKFMLPVGMAVAGYGQLVITLFSSAERVPFLPLKIKVANTKANWTDGVISGTISIGKVETLPPQGKAYAVNVGTPNDAIINLGIPEGQGFKISKTYSSIASMQAGYDTDNVPLWSFVIIDTGNVDDEDNAKLYIKGETEYQYLTDLSGAQGIQGEQGIQGVGISNVTPNGTDTSGGNIYKITLTNGETYNFTAPKGAKGYTGATGNGIASTIITFATSTSGTTAPITGWQSTIPTVAKGSYLWTRTVITYTDGTASTSYTSAYQGMDGTGAITGVKGAAESTYRTGNVNLTPANIGAVNKSGDTMTGSLNVNGDVKSTGRVDAVAINLTYSTPFIDFHYNNVESEYSARLICDSPTNLTCKRDFSVEGIFRTQNQSNLLTSGNEFNFVYGYDGTAETLYINYKGAETPVTAYILCDGKGTGNKANLYCKSVDAEDGVYDSGQRVYSPNRLPPTVSGGSTGDHLTKTGWANATSMSVWYSTTNVTTGDKSLSNTSLGWDEYNYVLIDIRNKDGESRFYCVSRTLLRACNSMSHKFIFNAGAGSTTQYITGYFVNDNTLHIQAVVNISQFSMYLIRI